MKNYLVMYHVQLMTRESSFNMTRGGGKYEDIDGEGGSENF